MALLRGVRLGRSLSCALSLSLECALPSPSSLAPGLGSYVQLGHSWEGSTSALRFTRALLVSAGPAPTSMAVPWSPLQRGLRGVSDAGSSSTADAAGRVVAFPLAQTGEGISECEMVQWHVKEGDNVEAFQPICEVQSDKASVEITSQYEGRVLKLHHKPGDMVKVGAPLLDILVGGGELGPAEEPTASAHPEAPTQPAELSTPGAHAPPVAGSSPAPAAPPPTAQPRPSPTPPTAGAAQPAAAGTGQGKARAAPAVRARAAQLGLDLAAVAGSGEGGRILLEDVERMAVGAAGAVPGGPAHSPAAPRPSPVAAAAAEEDAVAAAAKAAAVAARLAAYQPPPGERVPIRGYRRTMVKSSTAVAGVPMFYFCDEVRLDALMELRAALKSDPALRGVRLTYLPFMIKALSVALVQHPGVGAQLVDGAESLLMPSSHNIGIAMATPGGLVVPNIKAVEVLSIVEIAVELTRLQQLAAVGKLPGRDLSDGIITISNIGALGGTYATPLLNPPESAIVALGQARPLPRFGGPSGTDVVRAHVMNVSWGADHRVVDGAGLATFSGAWKALLEEPGRLLLSLR